MPRLVGNRLTDGARRRAIRQLQSLVAAGIPDDEAREQVIERYDVSGRTSRYWLEAAYKEMAAEADVDRKQLVGTAVRRRRLVMARAAKDGDWKTYLAAAESEAKLLGLNSPTQTEAHVVITKVQDMSKAVVETIADFYRGDPATWARFVKALRARLSAQIAKRPDALPIVIDAPDSEVGQIDAAAIVDAVTAAEAVVDDVALGGAAGSDAPSPA